MKEKSESEPTTAIDQKNDFETVWAGIVSEAHITTDLEEDNRKNETPEIAAYLDNLYKQGY